MLTEQEALLLIRIEKEKRVRAEGKELLAPGKWNLWLRTMFPKHFTLPFADYHEEYWRWLWAIDESRPESFLACWPRGFGKTTGAEVGVASIGARKIRKYAWYIKATQADANVAVQNVGALLQSAPFRNYYPEMSQRLVNNFGHSMGWKANRLRTASGFTIDAYGLDVAMRGKKIEEARPDFIVFDDIDDQHDTANTVQKKIDTITKSIIPAGAQNVAIMFIQNLIHQNGAMAQLIDGRAKWLRHRIVSGPHKAIENLQWKLIEGAHILTGGEPTWLAMDLDKCQALVDDWGLAAFLSEAQHEVMTSDGKLFNRESWRRVPEPPHPIVRLVRYWDLAATAAREAKDSDFTASVLLGEMVVDGNYFWIVLDYLNERIDPNDIWVEMVQKAGEDYQSYPRNIHGEKIDYAVRWEEEGGASGKILSTFLMNKLRKYNAMGVKVDKNKVVRAQPLAAQVKIGKVYILDRPHLNDYIEEMHKMPDAPHDDVMDASSGGYNYFNSVSVSGIAVSTSRI